MKIAVFIKRTTFDTGFGGLETQNKLLCEGLTSRGHTVHVFSPKREPDLTVKNENNVIYHFVTCKVAEFSSISVLHKESWAYRSYESFKQVNGEQGFDLIISQSSGGIGIVRNKFEFNIPIISILHGTKIGEFQTKIRSSQSAKDYLSTIIDIPHVLKNFFTVQRQIAHGSDKIVAVSNSVKHAIVDETYVDEQKVTVINNGMVPPKKQISEELYKPHDAVRLLYVGQVQRSKGIDTLIEILKEPGFKNFTLDVIGGGPILEELKASSVSNTKIKFHGKLSYEQVLNFYDPKCSDVFVFPTNRIEGFPMVLIEAMFGGLPVVAFNLGGIGDAVIDGETGYLVEAGNKKLFKEKLLEFQKDPKLIETFGLNAYTVAKKSFTLEKMLDLYENVIKESIK